MTDFHFGRRHPRNDEWVFDEILIALGCTPGIAPPRDNRRGQIPDDLTPYQQRLIANYCTQVLELGRHHLARPMRVLKQRRADSSIDPDACAMQLIDDQRRDIMNLSVRITTAAFLDAMRAPDRIGAMVRLLFGNLIERTWSALNYP